MEEEIIVPKTRKEVRDAAALLDFRFNTVRQWFYRRFSSSAASPSPCTTLTSPPSSGVTTLLRKTSADPPLSIIPIEADFGW